MRAVRLEVGAHRNVGQHLALDADGLLPAAGELQLGAVLLTRNEVAALLQTQ
jgi:hypothetical protein